MVEAHCIGTLFGGNSNFRLMEALSHGVTIIRSFIKNIDEVHAYGKISHSDTDGNSIISAHCISRKGDICKLLVNCSQDTILPYKIRCTLYGTKGTSISEYPSPIYELQIGGSQLKFDLMSPDLLDYYFDKQEKTRIPYGCYASFITHFIKNIDSNSHSIQLDSSIQQGLQTFIVVEAINRSIAQKIPIKVKTIRNEVHFNNNTNL